MLYLFISLDDALIGMAVLFGALFLVNIVIKIASYEEGTRDLGKEPKEPGYDWNYDWDDEDE